MANWYGTSRSNYFRVKDLAAFKEDLRDNLAEGVEVWEQANGAVMITPGAMSDSGGWPGVLDDTKEDLSDEHDILDLVEHHLLEGEVCIIMSVGAEKLRYVTGEAFAINWKGERLGVTLEDIYQKCAAAWGALPTAAMY